MSINEIRDFIFENYYKRIRFPKENVWKKKFFLHADKFIERIPDPCNAKEHYQSFINNENTKSVKNQNELLINQKKLKTQKLLI